ncbi:hypothetical protein QBC40DRAFT_210401 [Triangularia verruculosa]|uniref:Uncharacterized protein n=1 Tax=Triangularia verruculosa TaxID=2587418 RepID=A0AAN6XAF3_9PEZI|nr:hypothetical protein QBC40DRAFT_210401 [Triangularia verruculosa]
MSSPFATMTSFGPPPDFTPPGSTSTSSPSSTNSDDGNDNGLFSADHPWAWVLIPVLLLSSLGLLAACLHNSRRRRFARKQLQQSLTSPNQQQQQPTLSRHSPHTTNPLSRYAVRDLSTQRDLESGFFSPGQEASRWAWPRHPPPEEGLNELGEAPPPYDSPKEKITTTPELGGDGEIVEAGEGSAAAAVVVVGRELLDSVELQELDGNSPVDAAVEESERSWVEGDDEIDTRSITTVGSDVVEKEKTETGYDSGSNGDSDSEDERGDSSDHVYDVAEEVVITQPPPAVLHDSDGGRQRQQKM